MAQQTNRQASPLLSSHPASPPACPFCRWAFLSGARSARPRSSAPGLGRGGPSLRRWAAGQRRWASPTRCLTSAGTWPHWCRSRRGEDAWPSLRSHARERAQGTVPPRPAANSWIFVCFPAHAQMPLPALRCCFHDLRFCPRMLPPSTASLLPHPCIDPLPLRHTAPPPLQPLPSSAPTLFRPCTRAWRRFPGQLFAYH